MSAIKNSGFKGTTAQAASAGIRSNTGANKKRKRSAFAGIIISFSRSFKVSAIVCSKPKGPTLLGPIRACMYPITLRSKYTKKTTVKINPAMTTAIWREEIARATASGDINER